MPPEIVPVPLDTLGQILTFITNAMTILMPLGLAYIVYKQAALNKTIVTLEKNTNSIKDALVKVTEESSEAKGKLAGRAELKAELAARGEG